MRSSLRGKNTNVFLEARFLEVRKERARSEFFLILHIIVPNEKLLQIREAGGGEGRKEKLYLYTYIVTITQEFENLRFQES